ncbi:MAG: ABC-F family ATP-binding cassette domain-containing protein [Hyphomicrobiaceae bacterium]
MATPILALKGIALTFGGTPLLTGADLQVVARDRLCLVGRNGSGKSTLLKIAAGLVEPDGGEIFRQPGARIAYLAQEPDLVGYATTLDYVAAGFEQDESAHRARHLLEALGLTGSEHVGALSGGEARRAALARVLAQQPDVLLLDEPTNHLDLPAIEWLEEELAGLPSALVLISHDRRFLQTLSRTTVWLDRGVTRTLDRGFSGFEVWRDAILEEEQLAAHKLDRKIAREQDWMHGGVTARRKRNVRRVAELQDLRRQRREARSVAGSVKLEASAAGISGRMVIEAQGISKRFAGQSPLVDGLSLRVMRGDRIGIVGPNGAGKTTLLKVLMGEIEPDAGAIRLGSNIDLVWLDQQRAALDGAQTVTDVLTGGRGDTVFVNGRAKHVAAYMKDFLFLPEQARSPVSVLSGGERARLLLARALARPSNVLVLDEPTNDLDLETLDLLQELLAEYEGTLLIVSHDRDFLDRVSTGILAAEGGGSWQVYAGGYTDMIAQRTGRALARRQDIKGQAEADLRSAPAGQNGGSVSPPAVAVPRKRKLSFKEKHALETLPARIAELEALVLKLSAEFEDAGPLRRDAGSFAALSDRLAKAQASLSEAEDQWLELEALREDLEG